MHGADQCPSVLNGLQQFQQLLLLRVPEGHFGEVVAQPQCVVAESAHKGGEVEEADGLFGAILVIFLILVDEQGAIPDHKVDVFGEAGQQLPLDEPFLVGGLESFLHVPFSLAHCQSIYIDIMMMKWVQYVFDGFKAIVPRRKYHTYAIKFMWQMTPVTLLIAMYYSGVEAMSEDHPYLMRLYDLKVVHVEKPIVEVKEEIEKKDEETAPPVDAESNDILTPEAI